MPVAVTLFVPETGSTAMLAPFCRCSDDEVDGVDGIAEPVGGRGLVVGGGWAGPAIAAVRLPARGVLRPARPVVAARRRLVPRRQVEGSAESGAGEIAAQ